MKTDYGYVEVGDKIYVSKIYESCYHDDREIYRGRDGHLHSRRRVEPGEICEVSHIRPSGARSVDITFKTSSNDHFTQLKRLSTKVEVINR